MNRYDSKNQPRLISYRTVFNTESTINKHYNKDNLDYKRPT